MEEQEFDALLAHPEALVIPATQPLPCPTSGSDIPNAVTGHVRPDMVTPARPLEAEVRNSRINNENGSNRVSGAGSVGYISIPGTPEHAKLPQAEEQPQSDITWAQFTAEWWTPTRRLEFRVLWQALELTVAEVAARFGRHPRQLQRLRREFGLLDRRELRRLSRTARRHLYSEEDRIQELSQAGQALLRVAQARRLKRQQAQEAAASEKAWMQLQRDLMKVTRAVLRMRHRPANYSAAELYAALEPLRRPRAPR